MRGMPDRKPIMRTVLSLLLLWLASTGTYAQTPQIDSINVVEYGIYTAAAIRDQPSGQGIGHNTVSNIRLAAKTRTIPMQLGVHFGFRYTVVGAPVGTVVSLRNVTIYPSPGVHNPHAAQPILRHESRINRKIGDTSYHDYSFDDPWELVPGTWIMEMWYGDRKLLSQSFTVVKQ